MSATPSAGRGPESEEPGRLARLHLWQIQGVRDVVVVALVISIIYLGYAMRSVSVPLLVAFGLAYLVEPVVQALCRKFGLSRTAAVGTLMATAGVALGAAAILTGVVVVNQSAAFMRTVRQTDLKALSGRIVNQVPDQYRDDVERWFGVADGILHQGQVAVAVEPAKAPEKGAIEAPTPAPAAVGTVDGAAHVESVASPDSEAIRKAVEAELDRRGVGAATRADPNEVPWASILGTSAEQVLSTALAVLSFGFLAALVPFYFWFFSVNFPAALAFLRGLLPVAKRDDVLRLAAEMDRAVSGFVRGRIVVSCIMGVLTAIGWSLCGVPYAITLGVVVGVFSLVPYLSVVGLPIAIFLLAARQLGLEADAPHMAWLWVVLAPSIVYGVVQFLEGYVLVPVIAGKATDLDPVSIFVAVLAGAAIAGVYGMLLSIPVAACLKIYLREVIMPRLRAWSSGQAVDPLPFDRA